MSNQTLAHGWWRTSLLLIAILSLFTAGCERKEKVVDVETPLLDVEVERSTEDGSVSVDVTREQPEE